MFSSNPALNLAPFSRWTLRDKAAQRRLALRWALISMCIKRSFALLALALLALALSPSISEAGDPMKGVAVGVALFEACASLSPELAQRYKSWLERPLPELTTTVAEARQMPEYAEAKKRIAETFEKVQRTELARSCTTEFNREWWPK